MEQGVWQEIELLYQKFQKLGISEDEYLDWQTQLKVNNVVSLNEYMEQGSDIPADKNSNHSFDTPEMVIEKGELKEVLAEALELLTEKEKKVVLLYYYEELTLKEISNTFKIIF